MTVLDTPAQISMWVLLSRRHQIQLHLKGLTVKGLAAALKREFPGQGRYVKDFVVPVEFAISEAGGEIDYKLVNVHVMQKTAASPYFVDRGIYNSMDEASTPAHRSLFAKGLLEIVLTVDEPREATGELFLPA